MRKGPAVLDLRANRIGYATHLLLPPDGFRLERAVATTYSLDLETLLASLLPLAFGIVSDERESFRDGALLLRALHKAASRLTVFYQAGQIHAPRRDSALFPLLDRMLVPVDLSRRNGVSLAFHPKTWTVEYKNDSTGETFCRFSVLSRNLTFDTSLDVAATLESGTDRRRTRETKPLLDFLSFLASLVPKKSPHVREHVRRIGQLSKSLRENPLGLGESGPWTDFDILPLYGTAGRGRAEHPLRDDPLFSGREDLRAEEKPRDAVVVSPFLSESVVCRIANRNRKSDGAAVALVTRPESFFALKDRPSPETLPTWALKNDAVSPPSGANADAEEEEIPRDSDLHAKLYLWRRRGETTLLLGSMNATESGLDRNVEMLVRLRCDPYSFGGRDLLRELFGKNPDGPDNPFERISADDPLAAEEAGKERDRKQAQDAVRAFCRCATGRAEPDGGGFSVVLSISDKFAPSGEVRCSIRPLRGEVAEEDACPGVLRFPGFSQADLSEFFVFSAVTPSCTVSRIVQLPVEGIDWQKRDSAAAAAVVNESGGWKDYLGLLFSDDVFWTAVEQRNRRVAGGAARSSAALPPGLYEQMLRAVAEDGAGAAFAEAVSLMENQTGSDAERVRRLLSLFLESLSAGRKRQ